MKLNSFLSGFLLGLIFPILAYVLTHYTTIVSLIMPTKPFGLYVIAATINIIAVWQSYKKSYTDLGMGLVFTTFALMMIAVFTKVIVI